MTRRPIDWRELFASPSGRCPRSRFWLATAALLLLALVYEMVVGPTLKLLTFWFVYPALMASMVCVLSKRLHDRGKSGWWAALTLLGVVLLWRAPSAARLILAAPIMIWSAVELGLMPSELGANRFGANPTAAV